LEVSQWKQTVKLRTLRRGCFGQGALSVGCSVLFLFDSVAHLMKPAPVVEAFAQLGYPLSASVKIGVVLLVSVVIYLIPKTAVLGAVLLTGYLGGAVATHVRAGSTLFETVFPVIFGGLVWLGIFLLEPRLRALIPLRS
jgi:DoxX-like protein